MDLEEITLSGVDLTGMAQDRDKRTYLESAVMTLGVYQMLGNYRLINRPCLANLASNFTD
jgi:hypothetical protein